MLRLDVMAIGVALLLPLALAAAEETSPPPGLDDRDYLSRKQQEIFRLSIETDYALALQKLCQTGYGDPHLCHSMTPSPPVSPGRPAIDARQEVPAARPDLPVLQEIAGLGTSLSAILKYADGRVVAGQAGAVLPGGDRLVAVEPRRVTVKHPSGVISSLTLEGGQSAQPTLPSRAQLSAGQP